MVKAKSTDRQEDRHKSSHYYIKGCIHKKDIQRRGMYIVKKTVVASSSPGNMMALDLR